MRAEATTIEVSILLFAAYREAMGRNQIRLQLPANSIVDDLYEMLARQEPRMTELRPYTTFAVNREVVSPHTILQDGDEVALLQPVSGGNGD